MSKDAETNEDLFNDANVVTSNWWKPTTPGDKVRGYLVDKKLKPNTLKDPSGKTMQAIYVLMQEDGTPINVAGRTGSPQVIVGLESCKLGQLVGVKYIEDKPHTKAGYQNIKIVKAFAKNEFKPELVQQYKGAGFEDTSGEGVPFA